MQSSNFDPRRAADRRNTIVKHARGPASFSGSLMSNQRGGVLQPSWSDIVALAALVYLFYYILALALKRARANTPSGTSAGRRTQDTPRRSPRLKKAE